MKASAALCIGWLLLFNGIGFGPVSVAAQPPAVTEEHARSSVAPGGSNEQWYRSNAEGAELEAIGARRRDAYSWVLQLERSDYETTRRLYHNGLLVSEQRRDADSEVVERFEYRYLGGRRSEALGYVDDELVSVDRYSYTADGMLREVSRTYEDATERSSRYVFVRGRLLEELHAVGNMLERLRYDRLHRLERTEQLKDGDLVSSTRFFYQDDTALVARVETRDERTDTLTIEQFDREQRPVSVTVTRNGRTIRQTDLRYGAHGVVEERTTEGGRKRVVRFDYADDGTLLSQEERVNDQLQRRILHTGPDSRTEERYRGGALILRLHFRDDEEVDREVVRDAEPTRRR